MTRQPRRRPASVAPLLAAITVAACSHAIAGPATDDPTEDMVMRFTTRIDLGKDVGQNFGSLFEVPTADGRLVLGAGFVGVYNTRYRLDRYSLQFFVRPTDGKREFTTERLPRPSEASGTYMFDFAGKLHAANGTVRSWDETAGAWEDDDNPVADRMRLGDAILLLGGSGPQFDGKPILAKPQQGSYQRFYYALGHLFFYHVYHGDGSGYRLYESDEKGFSKLYACPWVPGSGQEIDLSQAIVLTLPVVGETTFAHGQLGSDVLTGSNIGGLYLFDGEAWKMLLEPQIGVSYQIYSMLNYYDRLLMGQYPTGELFEFDGENVTLLTGWPPRVPGVSGSAREAQTTTIYGGDLFVGVWPWGELWRYNPDAGQWSSMGRMFTHPPVTDKATHPYEKECADYELVGNQLGQRVTSLVPVGDSLMISTSAKWPFKWEPEMDFATGDKWKEYGSVIRLKMPGSLSVPLQPKPGSTELEFLVTGSGLQIAQDGEALGFVELGDALAAELAKAPGLGEVTWGQGVFGPFAGAALDGKVETGAQ